MTLSKKNIAKIKIFWKVKPFILVLASTLLLSFPALASAGVWDRLVGVVTAIPAMAVLIILAFIILLSQLLAMFLGVILNWVTGPNFISLSYTKPCYDFANCGTDVPTPNPIIGIGLNITQSFVNMALVIILIYVAVAFILRLGGGEERSAKKVLTNLIFIALLVNFAPVIIGLIVDASNIVMNYFLQGIKDGISGMLVMANTYSDGLLGDLSRLTSFAGQSALIIQAIVQIFLNFAIAFSFLLFSGIFIIRYLVIWILVILSPLAFVSWIHPTTKKMFWDKWWDQLIQWSIIGIPMAFFLYLGAKMYDVLPQVFRAQSSMPGIDPVVTGYFNNVFPFIVIVIFLFLGFTMGLQTGAMGAGAAISLSKKGATKARKWSTKQGLNLARSAPGASEAEAKIRRRMEGIPGLRGLVGGVGRYDADLKKEREVAGKNLDAMKPEDIRKEMQRKSITRDDRLRKARGLEILAETNEITEQDIQQHKEEALRFGVRPGTIYKGLPNAETGATPIETREKIQKRVQRTDAEDFRKNIAPEAFETPPAAPGLLPTYTDAQREVFYAMDRQKVLELGEKGTYAKRKALRNLVEQNQMEILNGLIRLSPREQERIRNMMMEIMNSINYV